MRRVLAAQYPLEPDVVREVEIRGLARMFGLLAKVPFEPDFTGRKAPPNIIVLSRGQAVRFTVPRGHWFVVRPGPSTPVFEVLSDTEFRTAFTVPGLRANDLAAVVAAEAYAQLGTQVELRHLDANDYESGMWAHPAMQAVITGIRTELQRRGVELWEQVEPEEREHWAQAQAELPVHFQIRPQLSRYGDLTPGYHPGSSRHAVPETPVRGKRQHAAGRALCETLARATPMRLGPSTIAPPDCPAAWLT